MRKCAVYLLAENRLLREALIRLLSKKSEVRIVGSNSYSLAVHREIIAARPQIILMDSSGYTHTRRTLITTLRSGIRNLRIVMVDMESDEDAFLDAVRAGVVGYVLKNASALEVAGAIRSIASGKAVCPPSLCLALFRSVMQQTASSQALAWSNDLGLSRREKEILELLRYRYTNKEIALRLNLSEQTVKNHVHHILRKLELPNRFSVPEFCENRQSRTDLHLSPKLPANKSRAISIGDLELNNQDISITTEFDSSTDSSEA